MTAAGQVDPVTAYGLLAPHYASISAGRDNYLRSVERLILNHRPNPCASLLDAGAADGKRALRLAAAAYIPRVVLLEPSSAMRSQWPDSVEALPIRLEQLGTITDAFDLIVCLWNVLGHVAGNDNRVNVLRQLGRLLSPAGAIFIDVANRYNARHYGWAATVGRYLTDRLRPDASAGDVVVKWQVAERPITSFGHVFTPREMQLLIAAAGLIARQRWSVDYASGLIQRWSWHGHLLYQLHAPAHRRPDSPELR